MILIINRSTGGVNRDLPGLLRHGPGLHLIVLVDLKIIKLPEQQQKSAHAQDQHHQQSPSADDLIGPAGGFALSVKSWNFCGTVCHAAASLGKIMKEGSKKTCLPAPRRKCVRAEGSCQLIISHGQSKYSTTAYTPPWRDVKIRPNSPGSFCR